VKDKRPNNSSAAALQSALPLLACLAFALLLGIFMHSIGQQHQRDISDLRKEIGTLNSGQVALGKDVGEIRDLLRRQPTQAAGAGAAAAAPQNITLSLGDAPFRGNANATVTLVEFTDYECGFC